MVVVVAVGCSSPAVVHPQSASAPLSVAADAQMIGVPAGQYIAGSTPEERDAAYDDFSNTSGKDTAREHHWFDGEDDRHVVQQLSAFHIDLMPVTQGAYAEFVTAGGAPPPTIDEAAWTQQGLAQDFSGLVVRYLWKDGAPPAGRVDHPVVLVTWDEASRYCAWRGRQVGAPRRLATEAEYEKAARGDSGLAYPWGNTFDPDNLNSAVRGPGDTMPVGSYIKGASPFGMLDAAGNVFEWTSTPFKKGQMTVKGSSWEDFGGLGRGASRHGRPPGIRHSIIGFRCAAD
jgi:formylglycine-generating enzyme required for sulfatase activity